MKKQFNRMKQLANQTVGRAEKTEVLSEDLLQIERRLDAVRGMCHQSHKRLMACFQGQHGTDADRRHKKLPLTALAQNMQEASAQLEESLLGKMLETCGDAENQLALELSQHEVFVEKEIVDPLCSIAEVEIPNIQKQRKQLAKLVLDWDSVRTRWNQAHKSSGTNFQGLPSKIDTLKEEMDEAGNKVEQCKDQLAADMYSFMAKEGEYGNFFVTLLEAQADYHRKALAVLEKALPEMQAHQGNVPRVPVSPLPPPPHGPLCMHLPRSLSAWEGPASQQMFIFAPAFSNFFQTQINMLTGHLQCLSNLPLMRKPDALGEFSKALSKPVLPHRHGALAAVVRPRDPGHSGRPRLPAPGLLPAGTAPGSPSHAGLGLPGIWLYTALRPDALIRHWPFPAEIRFPCKAIGLERNGRKPGPGVVAVTVEGTEHRNPASCLEAVSLAVILSSSRLGSEVQYARPPAYPAANGVASGLPARLEEHRKSARRGLGAAPAKPRVMLLLGNRRMRSWCLLPLVAPQGLFRIGAGASKLKKLKAALDCSTSHLDEFYSDPHAVAGALKSYLRELPEPLMTFHLYEEWTQVASVQDQDKKLQDLWRTCQKLPPPNFVNFRYLIKFLAKLAQTSDANKMTPSNIAIVLGPNLLWARNEGTLAEMAAATSVHVVAVIEPIIQHADWFFPGDVEFNVSEAFVPLAAPNSNHSTHTGNESDSGTLERKRPASMAVMEGDLAKKESFGVKLTDFQAYRRGGALSRKHTSPASQPPLPPADGGTSAPAGPEPPPQSSKAESSTGGGPVLSSAGTLEQGPSLGDSSPPKPKDPAAAPTIGRNGGLAAGGPNQAQPPASSHQLTASPAHGSAGSSPHTLRRAVKKPAPAPPKPGHPPPGHPGGQSSPGAAQHAAGTSPRPAPGSPSPPARHPGPAPGPTQPPAPRRASSSQAPLQAPSHPPPQPPTHSPPRTPTPPGTPPPGKQSPGPPGAQAEHTGTLPRPRPVPKPRNRPNVPPPPQPPGTHPGEGGLGAAPTGSRIVTDASPKGTEPPRSVFPEMHPDAASRDLPGHLLLDSDNGTESTAL
ncbi:rho GTPase-activating protein 17 [Pteropus medius]|uniref:rho GTPase-activating protein 17 n=1 Tax=Pteropus vampyrus TaxID=132908 RepID=UPI00196A5E31|nr:rho GTPase-activating protein 17 [Pteropus giganteus]